MFKLQLPNGQHYTYKTLRDVLMADKVLFATQQIEDTEIYYQDNLIFNNLGRRVSEEEWNTLSQIGV